MSTLEAPLPLSSPPEALESGYGFCLRILTANGLGLNWLRRRLGLGMATQLSASFAPQLGQILGVPAGWLRANLPEFSTGKRMTARYSNQVLTARNHLRTHRPQICPACIALKGYCSRLWDFSLSTVCLEHECYLMDQCHACGAQLRWERRSIDVCDCGAYIGRRAILDRPRPTPEATALQQALEERLVDEEDRTYKPIPGLPSSFTGLSADGLTTIMFAFGILPRALAITPAGSRQRQLRSAEIRLLISRAQERLVTASATGRGLLALRDTVADALLRRMALVFAHPNDRLIALQILTEIGATQPKGSMLGRNPELSQIPLFEEMPDV